MRSSIRPVTQVARVAVCAVLLNFAVPGGAIAEVGAPLRASVAKALDARAAAQKDLAKRRAKSASRLLTAKEEGTMQGRAGENPYLAGGQKWDVVYKGVDVMTGNYTTSATDMSFDGGYGIPVNVTRSYSANDADEGPFGKGWTLSADVRSTAGGLLKGGSAPVRSIPTSLKERAANEDDPNVAVEPAQAVTATDAGGTEETVQKDVDGILTTPAWDKNVYDSVYDWVTLNGQSYQVLVSNTVKTAEGTVYTYAAKGRYPYGTVPWNSTGATPTAANILKVTSATDRQGNVTTYTYGASDVSFSKSNGVTLEKPLTGVTMPGGHHLTFVWGTSGNATNRIVSVSDGDGGRTVHYGYGPGGLLTSVQTPGGKTTAYGYGAPWVKSGWNEGVASNLLRTITDPRGLTTEIRYAMTYVETGFAYVPGAAAYRILFPNGTSAFVMYGSLISQDATPNQDQGNAPPDCLWPAVGAGSHEASTRVGDKYGAHLEDFEVLVGGTTDVFDVVRQNHGNPGFSFGDSRSFREYARATEDLLTETMDGNAGNTRGLASVRGLTVPFGGHRLASTEKAYNFMGQPLRATTTEAHADTMGGTVSVDRTAIVDYAYWGAGKYYQQKAVRDSAGRYSYTDYYPSTAPAGKRGQTYRVYDPKNGGIVDTADPAYPVPSYQPPVAGDKVWRYRVRLSDENRYSAQFDYDAQGRPVEVRKLQKTTTSPWTYVVTQTEYSGGDGPPTWGQATKVTEDFGGINRVTQTNDYTSWGKADDVTDAAGHRFVTDFDKDGLVNSVTRVDVSPSVPVVTYAYGGSGVSNGQPVSVVDGLSGVAQTIDYAPSGGGVGMPSSVSETNDIDTCSVSYGYSAAGDRATATYQTDEGTTRWGYSDYLPVGEPGGGGRAFQTLTRLDSNLDPTAEELQYAYDSQGRLSAAAFAQSPGFVDGQPYVPPAHASYYAGHPASTRAISLYAYDSGGRVTSVANNWDVLNGNRYDETGLYYNQCGYELGGSLNRGLKTSSASTMRNDDGSLDQRTQTYGYDPDLDYLTSANYGSDGVPDQTPTWSYDAAGNRSDAVVDNLNRATSVGGVACTNDILGNRLTKGGASYAWDCLSRLTSQSSYAPGNYAYRADGMRIGGLAQGVGRLTRHDGQTPCEEDESTEVSSAAVRYGLGARGVDVVERTEWAYRGGSSGTSAIGGGGGNPMYAAIAEWLGVETGGEGNSPPARASSSSSSTTPPPPTVRTWFPLYDAHGSQVATLSRDGSGGFAMANRLSYNAWGNPRMRQSGGDPKLRYCASLGHRQDDESGLVYMRARYYEPTSGRFLAEDSARSGLNWFSYCENNPVGKVDASGKATGLEGALQFLGAAAFGVGLLGLLSIGAMVACGEMSYAEARVPTRICMILYAVSQAATGQGRAMSEVGVAIDASLGYLIDTVLAGAEAGKNVRGLAVAAITGITVYSLVLIAEMAADMAENGVPGAT